MKNRRKGVSLIVLIVTIVVLIILATSIILTLSKNNPIEMAREAKFKEDIRGFQDELALAITQEYAVSNGFRNSKINLEGYDNIKAKIPSFTNEYAEFLVIEDDKIVCVDDNIGEKKINWLKELNVEVYINHVPKEWRNSIADITDDGVPIPKGFTYLTGTKDTGVVIEDENHNEFVWVPSTEAQYVKDSRFILRSLFRGWGEGNMASVADDSIPQGIVSESTDVIKYGGFYIARYEAGIPEGDSTPSNKEGIPVSKKNKVVWSDITYANAKKNAENMINTEYVRTGLVTGTAWDRACCFIEDSVSDISWGLNYGNYKAAGSPANVSGYGTEQKSGYSEYWKVKNIYDLAGNYWEFTTELYDTNFYVIRSGSATSTGLYSSMVYRYYSDSNSPFTSLSGLSFRCRLYIK